MNNALTLTGIDKRYGPTHALREVGLSVAPGEVHALMGENGAGKSTLLKVLSGAVAPDSGQLAVDEKNVPFESLDPISARNLGIGIVHQEFSLIPAMTVAQNIFLGREPRRNRMLDRTRMRNESGDLLARLRSRVSPDALVEGLAVADAQLVEIAKALSGKLTVLAMDEPSAVLSGPELATLFEVVRELATDGVAILYVSHRLDEVFTLCDRFTVLKDGEVAANGQINDTNEDELVTAMVGRTVSTIFPPPAQPRGAIRLKLRDFQVDGLRRPIDLDVHGGEILGIAGLQGSGRTRLAKGIFGENPATGRMELDGVEQSPFRRPAEAIAAGLAYLPEDRKEEGLALTKTVRWNGSMLRLPTLRNRAHLIDQQLERDLVAGLIDRLSIKTSPDGSDRVDSLSGGNQQKVVVGKWLELGPAIVIFDEPTRGIDVGSKEQIYDILRELSDDGIAVVIISSEMLEVLGLSDRIIVMDDGDIGGELSGENATEEEVMRIIAAGRPGANRTEVTP
jgi:ribose transport system ATP-binding protein